MPAGGSAPKRLHQNAAMCQRNFQGSHRSRRSAEADKRDEGTNSVNYRSNV